MSKTKTHRPRISREQRDKLHDVAERLNGEPVDKTNECLEILLRYVDVLDDSVECPECGLPMSPMAAGVWHCRPCQLNRDVFDVLGTTDTDNHDIPIIPDHD